jgi:hypothetical protein
VAVHNHAAGVGRPVHETPLITDARPGSSRELASRQKRYIITMAFRTACFLSMIFVTGPFRWVLLAFAVFLPYVAVVFANQANRKGTAAGRLGPVDPSDAPRLTAGDGRVLNDANQGPDERDEPDQRDERDERVA